MTQYSSTYSGGVTASAGRPRKMRGGKVRYPKSLSNAPFRKASIDVDRQLSFNPDRGLPFGKKGVAFRDRGVTFRTERLQFRTGSVDLTSRLPERGKWKDKRQWKKTTFKRVVPVTGSRFSKLKAEKGIFKPVQTKAPPPVKQPTRTATVTSIKQPVTVYPMKEVASLPTSPYDVPRSDNRRKDAIKLTNIGVRHYNKGNYPIALEFFAEASRRDPDLAIARSHYGTCYDAIWRRPQ